MTEAIINEEKPESLQRSSWTVLGERLRWATQTSGEWLRVWWGQLKRYG